MPVMQMIPPANPHAIAMDHDYLLLTQQDEFLEREKVHKYNFLMEMVFKYYSHISMLIVCSHLNSSVKIMRINMSLRKI